MLRQYELVEKVCSYDPNASEDLLNKAYVFAVKKHGEQLRASGDPYFSHPVEVAGILTEYKLDSASIITALLHDTLEDTETTYEEIAASFGEDIAKLVDGVTKLSKIRLHSEQTGQAENFRKLLLAMSDDIRVLLVKLADRLHNMRTINFIKKPEKRFRIARETMEIYAPLAARIGMDAVKNELEGLSFEQLYPDAYESIQTRLKFLREQVVSQVPDVINQLKKDMEEVNITAQITGREKSIYSIWSKMQQQNINFEQLFDIMAFRIIVNSLDDCYKALGVVHSKYPMIPSRFKDYISTPKPNGYQSIHTGVIGPGKKRIEIQIRTQEMHRVAEIGVAAHWKYKQNENVDGKQYRWMRELLEILDQTNNPEEFLEHTKLEMYRDQVFCFSPKGDLIELPFGSSPIDFAYAVHSEVGNKCVGVKINGKLKPLRTRLENGDQVEILTSKVQTPSPEWDRFVVTGKAKAAIRRFIRQQKRSQYIELGQQLLSLEYKENKQPVNEKEATDNKLLEKFCAEDALDLYSKIGEGLITAKEVYTFIHPETKVSKIKEVVKSLTRRKEKPNDKKATRVLPIKGLIPGLSIHYARCCHPLPGDRIVGIVTTGKGVTIHTIDCATLDKYANEPERWLDIAWEDEKDDSKVYVSRLKLSLQDEPGSLGVLSAIVAKNEGNIININVVNRTLNFFDMTIDVEVKDLKHLTNIIVALRANSKITNVKREKN